MSAALEPVLLEAIGHPLRHSILLALGERVSSPVRLARELGQPLGRVSHHVRVLARLGAIELVDTAHRRGAVEHFYRATIRPIFDDEAWIHVPLVTRRAVLGQHLSRILADVGAAASAGGFDHPHARTASAGLELDAEGFDAIADILADTVKRLMSVRSTNTGSADAVRMEAAIVHLGLPA